ncbi:phytoene/squalene synthase family protein [Bartonella sp. B41]
MINFRPYCLDILRATDRDRYISVLFAPKEKRRALSALYAFNAEVSRIRESVHNPMLGEIRLRWWYDSIADGNTQNSNGSPILNDLFAAISHFDLPKKSFLRYCDAQILDLYNNSIVTIQDLETYCGETAGVILQLSCQILDRDTEQNFTKACVHGGIAQVLSSVLRFLSFTKLRYLYRFPDDILEAIGVNREELESNRIDDEKKHQIVEALVALSQDHYTKFYEHFITFPKILRLAFLPLAVIPASLQKAVHLKEKTFQENASLPLLYRYWLITKAAINGNFSKIL